MTIQIPEKNKKAGVCYAVTDDGMELPVIDITHPAFAFEITDAGLETLIEGMVRAANVPLAMRLAAAKQSILLRGLMESAGTYTSGMMTYLNKLGPDNLGDGYATPFDRQWAASLTPTTFRWRMQHLVRLLVDGLAAALQARPASAAAHLINIGGGPASDSLNALIVLKREHPELLAGRGVAIHVLDVDRAGPAFGARSLEALQAEGAPLYGVAATFHAMVYDWAKPQQLKPLLDRLSRNGAALVASTEGGLFEYASDEQIVANLEVLHAGAPDDCVMVGPVVRDASSLDPRLRPTEHVEGRPAIRYLGLEVFGGLAERAGWRIARTLDGPMHQVVSLAKKETLA